MAHVQTIGKNTHVECYRNLNEFLDVINSRPVNKFFANDYGTHSDKKSSKYTEFTGTSSYEEANELMLKGYAEGLRDMMRVAINHKEEPKRIIRKYDVVGQRFDVALLVAGVPECMINRIKAKKTQRVVTIYYNPCAHCGIEAHDYIEAGASMLALIRGIEARGIGVNLELLYGAKTERGKQYEGARFTLKSASQPLNALKMSYFFHPSFLRRHLFRWTETNERTNNYDWWAHGYPMKREDMVRSSMVKDTDIVLTIQDLVGKGEAELLRAVGVK